MRGLPLTVPAQESSKSALHGHSLTVARIVRLGEDALGVPSAIYGQQSHCARSAQKTVPGPFRV